MLSFFFTNASQFSIIIAGNVGSRNLRFYLYNSRNTIMYMSYIIWISPIGNLKNNQEHSAYWFLGKCLKATELSHFGITKSNHNKLRTSTIFAANITFGINFSRNWKRISWLAPHWISQKRIYTYWLMENFFLWNSKPQVRTKIHGFYVDIEKHSI